MGEPNDGVEENERRERFRFAPFHRRGGDIAPYRLCCRYAITKNIISVFDGWFIVGGGADETAIGVVVVNGGKNSTLEAAALFAGDNVPCLALATMGRNMG